MRFLQQSARPVQVTENDRFFRSLRGHHLNDTGDFHLLRHDLFDFFFDDLFDFDLFGHDLFDFDLFGHDLCDFDDLWFSRRAGGNDDDCNHGQYHGQSQ